MSKRVCIEATIPSFYYEPRQEPDMVARRQWTRQWWDEQRRHYELVTSPAVLEEMERGNWPQRDDALELLSDVRMIEIGPEIADIADVYIERQVMPNFPSADAIHLAIASYNHCDFLLTWNCQHLANANKFGHIRVVNMLLGLYVPVLTTPAELLTWRNNDEERSSN